MRVIFVVVVVVVAGVDSDCHDVSRCKEEEESMMFLKIKSRVWVGLLVLSCLVPPHTFYPRFLSPGTLINNKGLRYHLLQLHLIQVYPMLISLHHLLLPFIHALSFVTTYT